MSLTFKEYLVELTIDPTAADATQQVQRAKRLSPDRVARQEALKQKAEADAAKVDDTMSPQEKALERKEAEAARQRAQIEQKKQQQAR